MHRLLDIEVKSARSLVGSLSSLTSASSTTAHREERVGHRLHRCALSSDLSSGRSLHAAICKQPISVLLHNHLLNMYFKCGDLDSALHLFDEIPQRNVVTWSVAICGFACCGIPKNSLSFYRLMLAADLRPNEFTLVSTLKACALLEERAMEYQVYAHVVKLGFTDNVFLTNAFLAALLQSGQLADAMMLFRSCSNRDVVSWNSMINGLSQLACSEVWPLWCRMIREGVRPDEFTFSTVLAGMTEAVSLSNGLQVHAQLVKCGYGSDSCIGNALMDMYLKSMKLSDGMKAFVEMPKKDIVSWGQMAIGFLYCGQPTMALKLLKERMQTGVRPNKFTMATLLSVCSNLGCLEEGVKAHGLRIKLGQNMDACVDNALLDMYAKCGCMDAAQQVFFLMEERSVVTWTTMIMGFSQNGLVRDALRVYDQMILENVMPTSITFVCVLYACSQMGLAEEAWHYFLSMERDYGVTPEEEHYICLVDLLGRLGQIYKAKALIESMPFKPGSMIWQALLGACQIHGNIEVGEFAAEQVLAQDGQDSSTYTLLRNIFAGSNRWDGADRVRNLIHKSAVERVPGCSWIEVMNGRDASQL